MDSEVFVAEWGEYLREETFQWSEVDQRVPLQIHMGRFIRNFVSDVWSKRIDVPAMHALCRHSFIQLTRRSLNGEPLGIHFYQVAQPGVISMGGASREGFPVELNEGEGGDVWQTLAATELKTLRDGWGDKPSEKEGTDA